ncbi:replication protein [Chloroflexota bacterium]
MDTPQLENGFTQIAHEIIEELAKTNLSSYESSVVWIIIRKTYGFHKKTDWISLSQIEEATGIQRSNVCRTLNRLKARNIIARPDSKHIGLQKDHSRWKGKRVSRKIMAIV